MRLSARKATSSRRVDRVGPPIRRSGSFRIVGVGASAGGLEAFASLLAGVSTDPSMAFVLVQHLHPKHKSRLTEILSSSTSMPVQEATEGARVRPGRVYVIPPNRNLAIRRGILHLAPRSPARGSPMPVDFFLRSLAEDQRHRAIGVILSGTATDGVRGLKAIKDEGGITFAQDGDSAKYGGMPLSAAAAGVADFVLPPAEIARELERIGRSPATTSLAGTPEDPSDGRGGLAEILALLRRTFGTDFADYKDATIRRRLKRRMLLHPRDDPAAYLRFLLESPAEAKALHQDLLVHVTSFLRDPDSFEAMKAKVFPAVLEKLPPRAPMRIWVPGCATGEEAYSVAISLLEHLGAKGITVPIQIFGTDLSGPAIEKARAGIYRESIALGLSPDRLRSFFVAAKGGGYQVRKSVRNLCIFAEHDLIQHPPFSRLDFISCRNLLIYLEPAAQARVLSMLHYALNPHGFLMLGKSETVGSSHHHFRLVDRKHKIYGRVGTPARPRLDLLRAQAARDPSADAAGKPGGPAPSEFDAVKAADRIVQSNYAPAGVLINDQMEVLQFRGRTGPYLEPAPGAASLNLMKMAREGLVGELRAAILRAREKDIPVQTKARVKLGSRSRRVLLSVHPLRDPRSPRSGETFFLVLFETIGPPEDAPASGRPAPKAKRAGPGDRDREIEELRLEIAATREYLQSLVQEQEAMNQELKLANEEILSSNEELQSTNEELETAKEELQSSNEELTTLNEELHHRNLELGLVNNDLLNLLASINIPVVMLTPDLRIRRITPRAERVLNLIPGDVGRSLTDLRLNIDLPDLEERILRAIATVNVEHLEAQDKGGRWYSLWIRPYLTSDNKVDGAVLTLFDIDPLKRHAAELTASQARLQAEIADHERAEEDLRRFKFISDHSNDSHDLIDRDGRLLYVNRRACERLGYTEAELLQLNLSDIDPVHSQEQIQRLFDRLSEGRVPPFESLRRRKDGTTFPVEVSVTGVVFEGSPYAFIVARNITERKKAEKRLEQAVESAPNAMVMVNRAGAILLVNAQTEKLLGYRRDELIGMPIEQLLPERFRRGHGEYRKSFFAELRARPMGAGRGDLYALRKDGREVPVEIGLNPIETDEGTCVLGAIVDISERKRAEEALKIARENLEIRVQERTAELYQVLEELRRQGQQRSELAARLSRLQDDERRHLARQLHDSTGQNLVALKMDLSALREKAGQLEPRLQEKVVECLELSEQCVREVRTLSYLLHPPLLDERGLASALRLYCEGLSQRSGLSVDLDLPEDVGRLPPEIELGGFRIVQECLTNVHRHSKSLTARVSLRREENGLRLEVSDAGQGFQDSDAEGRGVGIRGMRERVRQLGGSLEIESGPAGTRVSAILPLGSAAS